MTNTPTEGPGATDVVDIDAAVVGGLQAGEVVPPELATDQPLADTAPDTAEDDPDMPTVPGFYYSSGSANVQIYMLNDLGQWYALSQSMGMALCAWGYIQQSTTAFPLERMDETTNNLGFVEVTNPEEDQA